MQSSVGFRALSKVFQVIQEYVSFLATPSYSVIRQWFLKLGLYKLQQCHDSQQRWTFIIDTSIQMGPQKFVVVLGVNHRTLEKTFMPSLGQVEIFAMKPLYSCPGEVICDILNEASAKINHTSPVAIVSDQAAELKKGVRLFAEKHPSTIHILDASHKIDGCLKKRLENDNLWILFKKDAAASMQNLKLSALAHLVPPKQRIKTRLHNSFPLIEWGIKLLSFLDSEKSVNISPEDLVKINWIEKYRFALPSWLFYIKLSKTALELIHDKGCYSTIVEDFLSKTEHFVGNGEDHKTHQSEIAMILGSEGLKVPSGEHYLGSSEVIESLFGKYKGIEGDHASSGLTKLILGVPALVGEINENILEDALNDISINKIDSWVAENMGETYRSKRKIALGYQKPKNEFDLDFCDLYVDAAR